MSSNHLVFDLSSKRKIRTIDCSILNMFVKTSATQALIPSVVFLKQMKKTKTK